MKQVISFFIIIRLKLIAKCGIICMVLIGVHNLVMRFLSLMTS